MLDFNEDVVSGIRTIEHFLQRLLLIVGSLKYEISLTPTLAERSFCIVSENYYQIVEKGLVFFPMLPKVHLLEAKKEAFVEFPVSSFFNLMPPQIENFIYLFMMRANF